MKLSTELLLGSGVWNWRRSRLPWRHGVQASRNARARSAAADEPSASCHAPHHERSAPPPHMHCNSGRSDSSGEQRGDPTSGIPGSGPPEPSRQRSRRTTGQSESAQRGVPGRGRVRHWSRPRRAPTPAPPATAVPAGRSDPRRCRHLVTQLPAGLTRWLHHRVADGALPHDECPPWSERSSSGVEHVGAEVSAGLVRACMTSRGLAGSATPADDQAEVVATGQAGRGGRGEHGASGSGGEAGAARAPASGQDRAARARYAFRSGTHGSWRGDGCWAGRCAYPCSLLGLPVLTASRSGVSPAAPHTGHPHYTDLPDESRGRRIMFRRSLAPGRAKTPAASGRPFESTQLRAGSQIGSVCATTRHPIRRQTGPLLGVTVSSPCGGRHALLACSSAVSTSGPARVAHTWRRAVRTEHGPRRWTTQCEVPMCPRRTFVPQLWTTCGLHGRAVTAPLDVTALGLLHISHADPASARQARGGEQGRVRRTRPTSVKYGSGRTRKCSPRGPCPHLQRAWMRVTRRSGCWTARS